MELINIEIPEVKGKRHIKISDGFIVEEEPAANIKKTSGNLAIEFTDAICFPGLINSHDHLEFNLFPKLGNRKYKDYIEWGADIHKINIDVINEVLKIPLPLRIEYGIYKNLLSGVTTVVHHGNQTLKNKYLIDVVTGYNYLHSVKLEKYWRTKLNLKFNRKPFVIHTGEGTNLKSYSEINQLIRWNIFNRTLVGIHGISMDAKQAEHFKALVWCPVSNDFLYGGTSRINKIKEKTTILFGTDSNVSADWNLWQHLRFARKAGLLNDLELYKTVTTNAANIWNLKNTGILSPGFKADLVIAEKKYLNFFDSFFAIEPENILMLIKDGKIILIDSQFSNQLKDSKFMLHDFTEIKIGPRVKLIAGKLNNLCRQIETYSSNVFFPFELVK